MSIEYCSCNAKLRVTNAAGNMELVVLMLYKADVYIILEIGFTKS